MANIPLSEVPQAPALTSVAKPALTEITPPQDQTWRQIRGMIDQGAQAMTQRAYNIQGNPDAAAVGRAQAVVGEAQVKQGEDIVWVGSQLGKVARSAYDIIKTNAAATFLNNYTLASAKLKEQMQSSDPSTWQLQQQRFNANYADTVLKGINPIGLHAIAPDILKRQAQDTAETGIAAHSKQMDLDKTNQLMAVTHATDNGDYKTAGALVSSMQENGLLSPAEASAHAERISATAGKSALAQQMTIDPDGTAAKLQEAYNKGNSKDYDPSKPLLPEWPTLTRAEIPTYIKAAEVMKGRQQDGILTNVMARAENHEFPDVASLQADPLYKKLSPENQQAVVDGQLNKWSYGVKADEAINAVHAAIAEYRPATDSETSTKQAITRQILSTVPQDQRKDLIEELHHALNANHDQSVVVAAKGEIGDIARKAFPKDQTQIRKYSDDVKQGFLRAWADPKQRGNGTIEDARQVINGITKNAKAAADAAAASKGGFWNSAFNYVIPTHAD